MRGATSRTRNQSPSIHGAHSLPVLLLPPLVRVELVLRLRVAQVALRHTLLVVRALLRARPTDPANSGSNTANSTTEAVAAVEPLSLRRTLALPLSLLGALAGPCSRAATRATADALVLCIRLVRGLGAPSASADTLLRPGAHSSANTTLRAEPHEALRATTVQRLPVLTLSGAETEGVLLGLLMLVCRRVGGWRIVFVSLLVSIQPLPMGMSVSTRASASASTLKPDTDIPLSLGACTSRTGGALEHGGVLDEGRWCNAVSGVVWAAVVLVLRVRVIVVRHGCRVALSPRARGRWWLSLSTARHTTVLTLRVLRAGRGHARRLLRRLDVLMSKHVPSPKRRLLIGLVEAALPVCMTISLSTKPTEMLRALAL